MEAHLQSMIALCGSGGGAGMLVAMLLAGLVGSVAHCVPMCGPFVLAQVSSRLQAVSAARMCERHRVSSGLLLPYHFGRLVTYSLLGALAAGSGAMLGVIPGLRLLPSGFLLIGACIFAFAAMRRIWPRGLVGRLRLPRVVVPWAGLVASYSARIDATQPVGAFLLGILLGFLPCGLLYSALAVAGTAGSGGLGALAMLAFGLGTVPSLSILGIAGQLGVRRWTSMLARLGPPMLLLSAAMLLMMAWQIS